MNGKKSTQRSSELCGLKRYFLAVDYEFIILKGNAWKCRVGWLAGFMNIQPHQKCFE